MKDKVYSVLLLTIPLVVLFYFLIQEIKIAGNMGFPLDDAWIFWVFAKNLAAGQGFSYNPGDPVLGTTSILWVLVLAGSYLLSHNVVLISKLWGVVFFLSAVLLTYRICLFYTRKRMTAFIGVLTFALAPALIFGTLSGMEIPLAALLFCLTLFFHLKERGKQKKIFLAPIFGALCFIARPELITVYPLLLMGDYLTVDKKMGGWTGGMFTRKLVTFVLLLCFPFVFSYLTTGTLLPHTFAAKTLDSGLIWAVQNGNLHEILISLSLNPLIWVGCMLALLVRLNVFWAFFWSKGAVLSFLRKDAFIYPVIFFTVPMVRGIVAPMANPFLGAHRYVSFLFPLLALFFVIGWSEIRERLKVKTSNVSLRKGLWLMVGSSLFLTFVFYANPLVKRELVLGFFTQYYFPTFFDRSTWMSFADFKYVFCFSVFFVALVSLLGTTRFFSHHPAGRKIVFSVLIAGTILQVGALVSQSQDYALSIKNINEMEVHLGKWMNRNIPPGSLVAINDAGAIKFFGDRRCLDLEGLVSPEIIPYKILGGESYIICLNKHRPDYFIIFPAWYPILMKFLSLKRGTLYEIQLENNVAVGGGGHMIVAKPDWKYFDDALQNSGLLNIKPYVPQKSFKRRWRDIQERQGFFPNWKVYHLKGREAEREGDLDEAERLYLRAESYDPQHHEFYLQMAVFFEKRGNHARSEEAFRKSIQYQLFPPPNPN